MIDPKDPNTWKRVSDIPKGQQFMLVNPVVMALMTGVSDITVSRDGKTTLTYTDNSTETAAIPKSECLIMAGLIEAVQSQRS